MSTTTAEFIEFLSGAVRALVGVESFTDSHVQMLEQQILSEYGGDSVYVVKSNREEIREAVLREFDGRNRKELCCKYGIGRSTFYRMLKGE